MSEIKYRIYPSLLDKFQRFLDSEQEFESHWNVTEDGEYRKTYEEICDENEKALLDAVNRVPFDGDTTAMDKGTCFNEIIDCIVNKVPFINQDIQIESIKDNNIIVARILDDDGQAVKEFIYDMTLCRQLASYYKGALTQYFCKGIISTAYGDVELYGYADVCLQDKVIDIKTTKNYTFGDYENRWQRYVYPYCLTEAGNTINEFSFDVVKWSGGGVRNPVLSGDMYEEVYGYNHAVATVKLRNILERFIEWIETKKELITDKKIFGL